jgi:hypothetical protein
MANESSRACAFVHYVASDATDGQTWTMVPPPPVKDGVKMMAYDAVDHLVFGQYNVGPLAHGHALTGEAPLPAGTPVTAAA